MSEEFLNILSRYQGIIHKVNLIYFRNRTDRDDNFQETVYQLWRSFPGLRNRESLGSWIYAVAINTALSKLKKINHNQVEYVENIPDTLLTDNQAETLEENTKMLIGAIQSLNEIDRSIMMLYLEEKSYNEIASIMGITVSNVGVRINRSKEILKNKLTHLKNGN